MSNQELLEEIARRTIAFFGSVEPKEGDVEELAKHISARAVEWCSAEYDLGIKAVPKGKPGIRGYDYKDHFNPGGAPRDGNVIHTPVTSEAKEGPELKMEDRLNMRGYRG